MGLLDGIEKLINEHGSAAILKERIALANDQYAALERKTLELQVVNKSVRTQLNQAEKEIEKLRNIVEATGKHQSTVKLNNVTEKILKHLFDAACALSAEDVAAHFKLELSVVSYHFDQLLEREFILLHSFAQAVSPLIAVRGGSDRDRPATYIIALEGRRYAVEVIGI
jgi:hypothetical protein